MAAVAALPDFSGTPQRTRPLLLAVLLHGALLWVLVQNLNPSIDPPAPREIVISLIAPRSEAPQARPTQPAEPLPAAKPSVPIPQSVTQAQPPAVRDTPVPAVATPAPTVPSAAAPTTPSAPATAHESHAAPVVAPAPPAPAAHHPPAAPTERAPVTISSVEYLQPPKPDYPISAKRAGEQGKVVLRILIDEKGLPERVEIQQSAGFARLDEAARAAALRAVFKPHLEDGRAVAAYVLVPINFALK